MQAFKKLDKVTLKHIVPGCPHYRVGEPLTVLTVENTGTKRNPAFRYLVLGAWLDHDEVEAAP